MHRSRLSATFFATLLPAFLLVGCLQLPPTVDDELPPQPGTGARERHATGAAITDTEDLDFADAVESSEPAETTTGSGMLAERPADSGILEIGNPEASNLVVFTNFSCEYCKDFAQNFLPQLEQDFIAKGQLRVQTIILPLKKYPNSTIESAALICATKQEKGRLMHDALFDTKARSRSGIITIARENEFDVAAFQSCLDDDQTKQFQTEQQEIINGLNVSLIPSFFLYEAHPDEDPAFSLGETVTGLPTYPDLRGMIEQSMQ